MKLTLYILSTLLFAIELVFLADYLLNSRNRHLKVPAALAGTVLCFSAVFFCCRDFPMLPFLFAVLLPAVIGLFLAVCFKKSQAACRALHYACDDSGKSSLYAEKKVMLIVPHQDDDLNIASGILEQYVAYGSEVFVVFVTNGDYWDIAEIRLTEALLALDSIGIPEDHVIFLGYADGWDTGAAHIYNAAPGQRCKSRNGHTATYALKSHPAWRDGNPYTADHLLEDMQAVILKHRPDLILCSDYDPHIEHAATTLAFEKAMGRILKQEPAYHPVVLKAFAYCTAWRASKDFPTPNLLSTMDPEEALPGIYQWSDRIRFPVDGSKLSRSLLESELYRPFRCYASQRAGIAAGAIINGDKVFWQRRTDSLLLHAQIDVSSGNAEKLNDFMLFDSDQLWDTSHRPLDGVWVPDRNDDQKTIHITLPTTSSMAELVLYGPPAADSRVLNARVLFDNGYCFETGPLKHGGGATSFPVSQKEVRSFTVQILEAEGAYGGLCEIEAFRQAYTAPFSFVKLMNADGHFAYDYMISESGTEALRLYTFGNAAALSPQAYRITCDRPDCAAVISGDQILMQCPMGASCNVTITSCADDRISDSIFIRNPRPEERKQIIQAQKTEEFFHRQAAYIWRQTILCTFSTKIRKGVHSFLRRCKYFLLSLRSR